ncbi:hypothetical protein [Sporomusa malonica]|uniref:Apolipoprotein N-acyltransferase n=1 Tax=Sporomusa malonica TaxID=112901 RepID=A0A1W2E2W2_9FIRM|nr:hypothetical protein [Sporomusa malonica]SMD04083.1 apolipoprotein N-acyltransferase [Sporomusa malonica]
MSIKNRFNSGVMGKYSNLLNFIFAVVLSSLAYYLSTELWIFAWLAPLPLCIYALETSVILTMCAGFITHFIGASNPQAVLPSEIFLFETFVNAVAFTMMLCIFRYITIKRKWWTANFVFASGFTAYEFITSLYSPNGTVASLAYTQASNLPVIQIASITGIWGMPLIHTGSGS